MYKVSKGIASELGRSLLQLVFNSLKTTSFLGLKIWDLVPHGIKQKEPVAALAWNSRNCPCKSCKKFCQYWIYFKYDFLGLINFNKKLILP